MPPDFILLTLQFTRTEKQRIIESIVVIEFFEREKQYQLPQNPVNAQLKYHKTNYAFDPLKTFIEKVGVVLIIIKTTYPVFDWQMTLSN